MLAPKGITGLASQAGDLLAKRRHVEPVQPVKEEVMA
jgi:hypothetical protein